MSTKYSFFAIIMAIIIITITLIFNSYKSDIPEPVEEVDPATVLFLLQQNQRIQQIIEDEER